MKLYVHDPHTYIYDFIYYIRGIRERLVSECVVPVHSYMAHKYITRSRAKSL